MYRFLEIGDIKIFLYDAIAFIGSYVVMFYNDLRLKSKTRPHGYRTKIVSARIVGINEKRNAFFSQMLTTTESETFTMIYMLFAFLNRVFGDVLGTGANYFGVLFAIPFLWFLLSVFYGFNPLKQIDYVATCLPLYLIFVKLSCFTAGCCRGVPWEHGMHNKAYGGVEVPVQLIEAFWGLLIFIVLTQYKKKAKTGTVFPMYAILYGATRFCSEFLRAEENVFWILKTYHILCLIGVVFGIVLWVFVSKYRDRIDTYYDMKYEQAEKELVTVNEEVEILNKERRRQKQSKDAKKENERKRKEHLKKTKKSTAHSRKL